MYWWYPNHSVRDIASMVQWGRTQLGWLEHVTRHSPLQLDLENWKKKKKQTYIDWVVGGRKEEKGNRTEKNVWQKKWEQIQKFFIVGNFRRRYQKRVYHGMRANQEGINLWHIRTMEYWMANNYVQGKTSINQPLQGYEPEVTDGLGNSVARSCFLWAKGA